MFTVILSADETKVLLNALGVYLVAQDHIASLDWPDLPSSDDVRHLITRVMHAPPTRQD